MTPKPGNDRDARILLVTLTLLIALTLGSYRLAGPGAAGATAALLGVAALKGHLIAGIFMEMPRGPRIWMVLMSAFLLAQAALIAAVLPWSLAAVSFE